jgi:hypothetical protein
MKNKHNPKMVRSLIRNNVRLAEKLTAATNRDCRLSASDGLQRIEQHKEQITMACEQCGNVQRPDDKQSSDNWVVFPNVPCEKCGGKYVPAITPPEGASNG